MDQPADKPLAIRDERGRLLPGSRLAVGAKNPVAARVAELKQAMLAAVTPHDMRDVMLRLIDLTRHEDGKIALAAIELFQSRLLGKPKEHVEMDLTSDAQPVSLNLDPEDLAALDRLRRKISQDVIDAEVISVTPSKETCE